MKIECFIYDKNRHDRRGENRVCLVPRPIPNIAYQDQAWEWAWGYMRLGGHCWPD